jgi:hypothetical protein
MRGDVLARSARALPALPRGQWWSWCAEIKRKREQARIGRAVVIERMTREQRRARQIGAYVPGDAYRRPWR